MSFAQVPVSQAPARPFSSALVEVMQAPEYTSTKEAIRSIELDYDSRELVLQPYLEGSAKRLNENRMLMGAAAINQKPRVDTLGFRLIKPFSTGTEIEAGPSYEHALTPSFAEGRRYTVDWHVGLTQNLWKDAFGRSTDQRRSREAFERRTSLAGAFLTQSQVLFDFESLYWDWALTLRVSELQEKNVRRSREILRWVRDRFNRAAAESTDLLQAQALLTQRELQVSVLKLQLTQVGTRIERLLPNRSNWQPDANDLQTKRDIDQMVIPWKPDQLGEPSLLSYLQADYDARAQEVKAEEARESIRPDLDLQLLYGKNAINPEQTDAIRNSWYQTHEYNSIGLVFRTGLDVGSERRKVESARAARDAAKQRRDARRAENHLAWTQLKQEIADLENRVQSALQLVDLQTKKANAERERYRKGRSTAFQAITFEQEASEAEITLWTLYSLLRKTEARARLFAR